MGEALSEAEFFIEPGEGGVAEELYLPDKWRHGNRLTWKMEDDRRVKAYTGDQDEPELTAEDIASMTKRVASTPLPRAIEYFAGLPDYEPRPFSSYGFVPMDYTPESGLKGIKPKTGQKGGKPSRPSKFVAGEMSHTGYNFDDWGGIPPTWANPADPNALDPWSLHDRPVLPEYPEAAPRPERAKSPDAPPVWESDEAIKALYKMLASIGRRGAEVASGVA